jgi:hypothetical protein
MPGQYPTRGAVRPRQCDEAQQADATGRFFLCARCRAQVLICSCCDRGNIYCEQDCAQRSRRESQRDAGRRYQSSHRGRRNHAARARVYRARQNNVTHQGSAQQTADDVMPKCAAVEVSAPSSPTASTPQTPRSSTPLQAPWHCCWCGRPCAPFVRMDFLRRGTGRDP